MEDVAPAAQPQDDTPAPAAQPQDDTPAPASAPVAHQLAETPQAFLQQGKTAMVQTVLKKMREQENYEERPVYFQRDMDTVVWLALLTLRMQMFAGEVDTYEWPGDPEDDGDDSEFGRAWTGDRFVAYVENTIRLCYFEVARVHHAVHGLEPHMTRKEPFPWYHLELTRVTRLMATTCAGIMTRMNLSNEEERIAVRCMTSPNYVEVGAHEPHHYDDLKLPDFWSAYRAALAQQYACVMIYNMALRHEDAFIAKHPNGAARQANFMQRIMLCFAPFMGPPRKDYPRAPSVVLTRHGEALYDLVTRVAIDAATAMRTDASQNIHDACVAAAQRLIPPKNG